MTLKMMRFKLNIEVGQTQGCNPNGEKKVIRSNLQQIHFLYFLYFFHTISFSYLRSNAIIICIQKLLPFVFELDGKLFQKVAQQLTDDFNKANILFKNVGEDPTCEIVKFAKLHGIDVSAINEKTGEVQARDTKMFFHFELFQTNFAFFRNISTSFCICFIVFYCLG